MSRTAVIPIQPPLPSLLNRKHDIRCGSIYGLLEIVLLCYGTIHGQSRGFEEKLIIGFQAITSHRWKKPQAGM